MSESESKTSETISPFKLRIGIFLILLWWIPFWALAPHFASSDNVAKVTTIIVVIQTVIGLLGIYIVGKPVYLIVKATPRKKVAGKIWHILIHGTIE